MAEFLEGRHQIGHGPSPALQSPYQHDVNLTSPRRLQQLLPQLTLGCSGADLFHLHSNRPTTFGDVLPHGTALEWQSLLVVGGDAGVQAGAARSFSSAS